MITNIIIAIICGIVYPLFIILNQKNNLNILKSVGNSKLSGYKRSMFLFWLLSSLILVNHFIIVGYKLNFSFSLNIVSWIIIVVSIGFTIYQFSQLRVDAQNFHSYKSRLSPFSHYLPINKTQRNYFILLSISAGICEELIFRLFLVNFVNEFIHIIISIILINLIFGAAHLGSGLKNMLSATMLGLIFSIIYYYTNNIWIPMFIHTVIDLSTGIVNYNLQQYLNKLELEKMQNTQTYELDFLSLNQFQNS
jgi:membrane protease YdiL (CAAX protease family)